MLGRSSCFDGSAASLAGTGSSDNKPAFFPHPPPPLKTRWRRAPSVIALDTSVFHRGGLLRHKRSHESSCLEGVSSLSIGKLERSSSVLAAMTVLSSPGITSAQATVACAGCPRDLKKRGTTFSSSEEACIALPSGPIIPRMMFPMHPSTKRGIVSGIRGTLRTGGIVARCPTCSIRRMP